MDLALLFSIKKTQLEMIKDRGYNAILDEIALTNEDIPIQDRMELFNRYFHGRRVQNPNLSPLSLLSAQYEKMTPTGVQRLLAFYVSKPEDKQFVQTSDVKQFVAALSNPTFHEGILITDASIPSAGKQDLLTLQTKSWQTFLATDLTYNPIRHVDTPPHELLSKEEAKATLRNMNITDGR